MEDVRVASLSKMRKVFTDLFFNFKPVSFLKKGCLYVTRYMEDHYT